MTSKESIEADCGNSARRHRPIHGLPFGTSSRLAPSTEWCRHLPDGGATRALHKPWTENGATAASCGKIGRYHMQHSQLRRRIAAIRQSSSRTGRRSVSTRIGDIRDQSASAEHQHQRQRIPPTSATSVEGIHQGRRRWCRVAIARMGRPKTVQPTQRTVDQGKMVLTHRMGRNSGSEIISKYPGSAIAGLQMVDQCSGRVADSAAGAPPSQGKVSLEAVGDSHKILVEATLRNRIVAIYREVSAHELVHLARRLGVEAESAGIGRIRLAAVPGLQHSTSDYSSGRLLVGPQMYRLSTPDRAECHRPKQHQIVSRPDQPLVHCLQECWGWSAGPK